MSCITLNEIKLYKEIERLNRIIKNLSQENERLRENLYRAESIIAFCPRETARYYYDNKIINGVK